MSKFLTALFLLIAHSGITQSITGLTSATPESVGVSSSRLARIDKNINEWVSKGYLNGGVALIVKNGKVVYHKGFGFDDPGKTKPIRTDAIFRIASQTKAVTSVAAMILYEEGKLLLDDPVSKYIPEFEKQTVLDKFDEKDSSYTTVPAKSEITIRQLLTHTSGIAYAQIGSKESNAIYYRANITAGLGVERGRLLKDDIKRLGKLPLFHQPGEKWTYGLNSDVLGYVVEVVSGMSLDAFFRTRIFEPLGMKDTYFYVPPEKHNRIVTLYQEVDGKMVPAAASINQNGVFLTNYPQSNGTYFSGGAGLSSTAIDYAIFLQMMLNGGKYNGKQILSKHTVRMMTMNQIGDVDFGDNKFGLGFGIVTEKGSRVGPAPVGSFEWGGAFSTLYWADPKEKIIGIYYRQMWGGLHWEEADIFKVLVYQSMMD
ncbi:MAG: beta-lactamase family protein [Chitinophagaceae bacterium]|nr:beta-lactamase family protein [Chitinophagaceae bacterium]